MKHKNSVPRINLIRDDSATTISLKQKQNKITSTLKFSQMNPKYVYSEVCLIDFDVLRMAALIFIYTGIQFLKHHLTEKLEREGLSTTVRCRLVRPARLS